MGGCHALPELSIETERLRIATSFDAPVCEGTLAAFDEHVDSVELALGQPRITTPILLYWLDDVSDRCGDGAGGCFYPGTHVVFAEQQSINHEMVHAVLDSTATSYFVEEGMAELYSGADVYYRPDPDRARPREALHMSRSEYRKGDLNYAAAAHFMRFVYDRKGEAAMKGLAETIAGGGSTDDIEEELESIFADDIADIESLYFDEAHTYYPGFAARSIEKLTTGELYDGVSVELDCADESTHGPLAPDTPGVYSVRWIEVQREGVAEIRVDGEVGGWVILFDPVRGPGSTTDWSMPQPEVDEDALRLVPGDVVSTQLTKGTHLLVFGADGDRTELQLRMRMEQPPGPLGEQG